MNSCNTILIKLSGEGLACEKTKLLDASKLESISKQLKVLLDKGIRVAIVIGGGNICRGNAEDAPNFSTNTLDNVGMISTLINGLTLSDILASKGIKSVVMSAMEISKVADFYNVTKAREHMDAGRIVILVGGIACSFFSTDTAAVVRAAELGCDAVFKLTQVDGIYSQDPKKFPVAEKLHEVTYDEFIDQRLKVMDLTSIVLARQVQMLIYVLRMKTDTTLLDICSGRGNKDDYSVITSQKS